MRRRQFLQLTGLGAGAYALRGARAGQPALRTPKRLVNVFVTGGWDTAYALDPRDPAHADLPPGAPQTFAGYQIFTDDSRPNVAAFFEKYAGAAAVVRGISTDAINHNECQRRIATGTREETKPDFGAIVAHDLGNDLPLPYLILGDTAWTGPYAVSAGRVGTTNQIVELLDPQVDDGSRDHRAFLSPTEEQLLRDYAGASVDRAHATRGAQGYNRRRVDDFIEAIDRAKRLRALRSGLGARGDSLAFTSQIDLAVQALEQDISHAVTISTGLAWDTHSDNELQNGMHDTLFAGVVRLVDELAARPGRATGTTMLDDTVVAVISEMSRTLYLGGAGPDAGKGHWPVTSALVIGGGVRGGQAFGALDLDGGSLPIDLSTGEQDPNGNVLLYSHFVAGLLALCGADPSNHLSVPVCDAFIA